MSRLYILEIEFPDRRQLDRTIALSRSEAMSRAHRLVDDGTVLAVRLIPLRAGRPIRLPAGRRQP